MRYKNVVEFKNELFFNGAVQLNCVYTDKETANRAASSYIFHSQKAFANDKEYEIGEGDVDTIHLVNEIFTNLYGTNNDNPFMMAIAGYGAGKSHLGTALSALLANNEKFLNGKNVIKNIANIDSLVAENIEKKINKPNLIFALNGMNDFDVTDVLYEQLKEYLKISEIEIQIFEDNEEIYKKMRTFVDSFFNFEKFKDILKKLISEPLYSSIQPEKDFICNNIEKDEVFSLVNNISIQLTGQEYRITNFLNPKNILEEAIDKLVGDGKPFDKIIILFDELGRYIKWLASKESVIASRMQQLYEGVSEGNGNILFISFIQFPINTYLGSLTPSEHAYIQPYIYRFGSSKQYRVSTVLENVFTNLIDLKEHSFPNYYSLHDKLLHWNPVLKQKNVWSDSSLYREIICDKLSPFHPLTISLLSHLSKYTQERGPLAILKELLDNYSNVNLEVERVIRPISVLNTSFIDDLVRTENSNYSGQQGMMYYNALIQKPDISSHLGVRERNFLKSIVVINLLELKPRSKDDYFELLGHLSGFTLEQLEKIENSLETQLGVINYDDKVFYHHMVIDYVGQRNFDAFMRREKFKLNSDPNYHKPNIVSGRLMERLKDVLNTFKSDQLEFTKTLEWYVSQEIVDYRIDLESLISQELVKINGVRDPNKNRSKIIWIYLNELLEKDVPEKINQIEKIAELLKIENSSLLLAVIIDTNGSIYDSILDWDTINGFSESEKGKFAAFIGKAQRDNISKIKNSFITSAKNAYFYINNIMTRSAKPYKQLLNHQIERIYPNSIPFNFDGFVVNNYYHARKEFLQVLRVFGGDEVNKKTFEDSLDSKTYRRLNMLAGEYGWNIFKGNKLDKPIDRKARYLFNLIDRKIQTVVDHDNLELGELITSLFKAPNGLNIYSATFLLFYVIFFHKNNLKFIIDDSSHNYKSWINSVLADDIEIEKIKNTVLKYYDISKDEKLLEDFIDKISQEKVIDKILQIWPKIKNLTENENLSDKVKALSSYVLSKVSNAEKFKNIYDDIQNEYNDYFTWNRQKRDNVVPEILKNIKELQEKWNELEKNVGLESLTLPDVWTYKIRVNFERTKEIVEKGFTSWFEKNNIPKGHNVDDYLNFSKNIEKGLYVLGLNNLARDVKNNVKEIGDTFELTRLISDEILELQNSLSKTDNFANIINFQKQAESLILEINLYDQLTEKQKENLIASVETIFVEIKRKAGEFNKRIAEIWNFVSENELKNFIELETFIKKIRLVLTQIDDTHSDYHELNEIFANVSAIKDDLEELRSNIRNKEDLKNKMAVLREKYSQNIRKDPDTVLCSNLFTDFENTLKEEIDVKIKQYMEYLGNIDFEDCCENKLNDYLDYIKAPPNYLGTEEYNKINQIKMEIFTVLEHATINEIKRMFELIEDRKIKIKLLKELKSTI